VFGKQSIRSRFSGDPVKPLLVSSATTFVIAFSIGPQEQVHIINVITHKMHEEAEHFRPCNVSLVLNAWSLDYIISSQKLPFNFV